MERSQSRVEAALLALIVVMLLLELRLVFLLNVNWDEFHLLGQVHEFVRGELANRSSTFHVELFAWLAALPGDEMTQIRVARVAMFALLVGSALLTYRIARSALGPAASLFSVLCYLTLSNVIEHGTSFRYDPICAFLFLAAVAALLRTPAHPRFFALAGACLATALLVTIKSLLYLPPLGLIALVVAARTGNARRGFALLGTLGLGLVATFVLLYALHAARLSPDVVAPIVGHTGAAWGQVVSFETLFPRRVHLGLTLRDNALACGLLLVGLALTAGRALREGRSARTGDLALLACALPLLAPAFYRNAYPYFIVFIASPAIALCGVPMERVFARRGAPRGRLWPFFAAAVIGAVFAVGAAHFARNASDQTIAQGETIDLVHALFPEPVPYLDRCSMIASYPNAGFFMSTWGLEYYRRRGEPVMREILETGAPEFLLANVGSLDLARPGPGRLLPEDARVLREHFVPHWGALYVPGKHLVFEDDAPGTFEILIEGPYGLEADGPVRIDGAPRDPGSVIPLAAGLHRAEPIDGTPGAVLRWKALSRPARDPSPQPLFLQFVHHHAARLGGGSGGGVSPSPAASSGVH